MYIDGSLENEEIYNEGYDSNNDPLLIGNFIYNYSDGHGNEPNILNGLMDEVRIYNRALSANEIQVLAATTSSSFGTVVSATGRIWMDRNLGASRVAISSTDSLAFGDLYQWGRGADGHQLRTSAIRFGTSSTPDPGHGYFFLMASSSESDWLYPQNNRLWQGVTGVNNPCPAGFRIPTSTELNTERLSWASNTPDAAFAAPLKLVFGGRRDNNTGEIRINDLSLGSYWTSTVHRPSGLWEDFAQALYIWADNVFIEDLGRGFGSSVRCIQD